jgi:hypothetical protein
VCLTADEKPKPVMALVQRWNQHVEEREESRRKLSVKTARKHRPALFLSFSVLYFAPLPHFFRFFAKFSHDIAPLKSRLKERLGLVPNSPSE